MINLDLEKAYKRRFSDKEVEFKKRMWGVLCKDFFQKYIPRDSVIVDIGAGYCDFINNISGKRKIALDLNPDVKNFANKDVEVIMLDCIDMKDIKADSCDIVFVSNFFEHLTKDDIVKTIREACRILKTCGKILILQPNIRFCHKGYWNFFDHITPLDDRSLSEVLETNGFKVIECRPRFLPYTTKSKFPKFISLIKIYLKIPILHYIFGKQAFICAKKV